MYERHIVIADTTASSGDLIAGKFESHYILPFIGMISHTRPKGINSNYGDTAKISGLTSSGVSTICERFEGNDSGDEPTSIGTGNDGTYCIIS